MLTGKAEPFQPREDSRPDCSHEVTVQEISTKDQLTQHSWSSVPRASRLYPEVEKLSIVLLSKASKLVMVSVCPQAVAACSLAVNFELEQDGAKELFHGEAQQGRGCIQMQGSILTLCGPVAVTEQRGYSAG